jgi:hypothetical protein
MSVGISVAVAIAIAVAVASAAAAAAHAHAIAVAAEAAVAGSTRRYMTSGEIGRGTDLLLTFDTWEGCPDQRAVHRPVDDWNLLRRIDLVGTGHCDLREQKCWGAILYDLRHRRRRRRGFFDGSTLEIGVDRHGGNDSGQCLCHHDGGKSGREQRRLLHVGHAGEDFLVQRGGSLFLPALRHARAFVGMLRVARCATCLLDVFFDHGDDRVVGNAALTWTVVVENVA